jgi:FYVE/RhoGEF/PH domain-containing protein 5/6
MEQLPYHAVPVPAGNSRAPFRKSTSKPLLPPISEKRASSSLNPQRRVGEKEREAEGERKSLGVPHKIWDEARLEKARNKRFHIAEELLKTEATYVERLHVIAVKFYGAVTEFNAQNKRVIPDGDVNRIFLNITQIHNLNTNIHDELQERMDTWSTQEGLGDVIERLAPFLKLYAHYTAGFEDAMKMLTTWTKREKKFDALVREFERELSTGLGVAHYMLEPVQRIPRYRLLLTDYLKYIPPGSPDRLPTQKALNIISEAADHSNDRIKELENSNTILSIQRSLQDFEGTLLAPGRLFLRRGQLQKFSRKTTTPRMFFLFSDMLLHTEPAGTDVYKFKNEMPIFMMKVGEPVVSLVPHSFNVESTTRSLILVASSEAEKMEWITELRKAISEERKKRSSLRREISTMVISGVFGAQAPIMVPDKSVTMCQACSAAFTFTFRRHHCRGCGKVVCGGCSQWKAYLPYLKKFERVCEKCNYVSKSESGEDVDGHPPPSPKMSKKEGGGGILDLKGYEEDTIKGGYVLSLDGRKWSRLWYQLKQDFCLYKFRAHEDIKAMSSLPLPGYIVNADQVTHTITLIHPSEKKELSDTFRLENPEDFDIWVLALEGVVRLEVPSLPAQVKISPPPDERFRSQSMRDLNAVAQPEDSPLENSI